MKSSGSGSIYDIQMDPSKVSLPMNSNIKVVSLRYQYCVGEDGTPISFTMEAEEQYQQDGKWTQIQSKVCDTLSQANQIKTLTMPKYPKWVPSTPTQGNQEVKIYYNSGTATVSGSN